MEQFLTVAFVLSNLAWLFYWERRDKRDKDERRELHNRLAEPQMVVPPDEIVKHKLKVADKLVAPTEQDLNIPEMYEHAAVGKIDPELHRGDNGN